MKIAIIMKASLIKNLFSEKILSKLHELGDVTYNQEDNVDEDNIKKVLKDADVAITSWGNTPFTKDLLSAAPNLKLVAHAAGSVKPIVSDELFERGIRVISSACELSRGVSETALGFAIAAAKNFFALNDKIHEGGWPIDTSSITELYDLTVGVIGCGFAGRHFIELLHIFGVDILAYDPHICEEDMKKLGAVKASLDEIFEKSNIISLHAPSIPETYHMVNEHTLGLMKSDAILINTARGSLVDELALYNTMRSGKLKYVCLDVTDPEPPLPDNPLRTLSNCIFTPHLAGLANNGKLKIGAHVYKEISRMLEGQSFESEVTEDQLTTIA